MNKYLKTITLTLVAGLLISITSNANSSQEVGTTHHVKYANSCEKEDLMVNPQFMVFRQQQQQQSIGNLLANLLRVQVIFVTTGIPTPDDILKEPNYDLSKFDDIKIDN